MSAVVKRLAARTPAPISLASLHRFATSVPTAFSPEEGAVLSHKFLSEQISIRAARRFEQTSSYPFDLDGVNRIREKYEVLTGAHETLSSSADAGAKLEAAAAFGKWLHSNLSSLENDVSYMQEQLKDLVNSATTQGQHVKEQQDANTCMENMHIPLITWRLLSSQHELLLSAAGVGSAAPTRKAEPKQHNLPPPPISIASVDTDIHQLIEETAEDCRAFCIEKNGEAPDVKVLSSSDLPPRDAQQQQQQQPTKQAPRCLLVEGHVHFAVMEILKNSMGAMVQHWGQDLIDAPPIQVQLCGLGSEVGMRISDRGGGIPRSRRAQALDFFHTSAVPMKATYGYSKAHGAAFTGMGVGLPMARIYARLCGGDLSFNVLPGYGTDTFIILNRAADMPFPV